MAQSMQDLLPSSRRASVRAEGAPIVPRDGLSDISQGFSEDIAFKFPMDWVSMIETSRGLSFKSSSAG